MAPPILGVVASEGFRVAAVPGFLLGRDYLLEGGDVRRGAGRLRDGRDGSEDNPCSDQPGEHGAQLPAGRLNLSNRESSTGILCPSPSDDPESGSFDRFEEGQLVRRAQFELAARGVSFAVAEIAKRVR